MTAEQIHNRLRDAIARPVRLRLLNLPASELRGQQMQDIIAEAVGPAVQQMLTEARPRWQPVVGWEGRYEVSSLGIVRAKRDGRLLGQWPNQDGYLLVRLSHPRHLVRVHRLVAEAHVPNPNALPVVNHLDADPANNCAANLEWTTRAGNLAHADSLGRMVKDYWNGKRSPNAALTAEQVDQIRALRRSGASHHEIATNVGTNKRTVGRILSGKSYVPLPAPPER